MKLYLKKPVLGMVMALVFAGVAHAQADEARAKKIVNGSCFLCHGAEGESSSEIFPRLAGQHWQYIAKQLENFKTGVRDSTAMADMSAKLTPDEMIAIGKYFEKAAAPAQALKEPDLAGLGSYIYKHGNKYTGVPACASCHGKDALGTSTLPRLAGQYAIYIESQLQNFGKRKRNNDNAVMHSIASKMSPLEIAGVAEYLSGQ